MLIVVVATGLCGPLHPSSERCIEQAIVCTAHPCNKYILPSPAVYGRPAHREGSEIKHPSPITLAAAGKSNATRQTRLANRVIRVKHDSHPGACCPVTWCKTTYCDQSSHIPTLSTNTGLRLTLELLYVLTL